MITEQKLRVFAILAECGSFTEAARHLDMSQSAVSQNISQLEQWAGGALFVRSPGSVVLSPRGELLLHYARRILTLCDELSDVLSSGETAPRIHPGVFELGDGRFAEVNVREGKLEISLK